MRSLTNKTANIKYKNLSVYKTVHERLSHISKTAKIIFFREVEKTN